MTTDGELLQSKATESEAIKSEATHTDNQNEVEIDVLEPKLDVSADRVKTSQNNRNIKKKINKEDK
ncbi:MAG: hypothetical protein K0R92_1928 [Lachnospiraceae bacterium]|nr:hypothetical protein [Lachnospiraceae bacterium]